MMAFDIEPLDIPDVKLIHTDKYSDSRGFFTEMYRRDALGKLPLFVQDNLSVSCRGTLRGLHYQLNPFPQAKLVSCIKGYIVDVAVDIRKESKTYGKYVKVELFGPQTMIYVPPGFAHGFLALENNSIVSYKCSNYYSPEHDRNILWNDQNIGIEWHENINNITVLLSQKDENAPLLKNADNNF